MGSKLKDWSDWAPDNDKFLLPKYPSGIVILQDSYLMIIKGMKYTRNATTVM